MSLSGALMSDTPHIVSMLLCDTIIMKDYIVSKGHAAAVPRQWKDMVWKDKEWWWW